MKKLIEHTYGTYIYMKLQLDDGKIYHVDEYFRNDGTTIKTSGDYDKRLRESIIKAYNELY